MKKHLLPITTLLALTLLPARATVIYSQNFDTGAPGWSTGESTGGATAAWSSSVGNPPGSMFLNDGSITGNSKTSLGSSNAAFSNFNTSTAGQTTLNISFDLRVDSFLNNGTLGSARFVLFNQTAAADFLAVGFGSTNTTVAGTNVLFANPTVVNPSLATAFGGGTGAWNFGSYDTTTGANNDTNGWIHLSITYVNQSNQATVMASYGSNSASRVLTVSPTTWGKPTGAGVSQFVMIMQTGQATVTSQAYFDNLQVQVIPEPSAGVLVAAAAGLMMVLRRRK